MRLPQAITALVFDAYGTLFDLRSLGTLCQSLFPEQGAALSRLWRAKQVEYTWLLTLMARYADFWHVTESALGFACRALQLPCDPATRARLMDGYLRLTPYPDVLPALQATAGYRRAILSNGSPHMLRTAVATAELEGLFARVISVDEAKAYKPSPLAYQLALKHMGVSKGHLGFVSSNSWDVVGAKAFGFWTCWVNRDDSPAEELGVSPDLMVHSLTELGDPRLSAP